MGAEIKIKQKDYLLRQSGQEVQAILDTAESRVLLGTTEEWNNRVGFIPNAGQIIVYTDHGSTVIDGETVLVPGVKIGSGNGYVQDLAFVGQDEAQVILDHIADTERHVSASDREFWGNKLNLIDESEITDETLVFNRN